MSGTHLNQDLISKDNARLPPQPFPLVRALAGVLLLAMTGAAAGLVAFAPV